MIVGPNHIMFTMGFIYLLSKFSLCFTLVNYLMSCLKKWHLYDDRMAPMSKWASADLCLMCGQPQFDCSYHLSMASSCANHCEMWSTTSVMVLITYLWLVYMLTTVLTLGINLLKDPVFDKCDKFRFVVKLVVKQQSDDID